MPNNCTKCLRAPTIPAVAMFIVATGIIVCMIHVSTYKTQVSGIHYIFDLNGVSSDLIYDNTRLTTLCDEVMKKIQVKIINKAAHEFQPHGLTLLYLLSESHFSLHTWPEHNKMRMDFFSCQSDRKSAPIVQYVQHAFGESASITTLKLYR